MYQGYQVGTLCIVIARARTAYSYIGALEDDQGNRARSSEKKALGKHLTTRVHLDHGHTLFPDTLTKSDPVLAIYGLATGYLL